MDDIIIAKHLKKTFGNVVAINDISFSVKRGSLFAFLGLNGAGKSTTINILCSIIKKDEGEIIIDGYNLDKQSQDIKSLIGIVFQTSVLDKQLTVHQNLQSRASLYGMSKIDTKKRIEYLTEILELKPIINRTYESLSGGQKRKIDIARALIHYPKILFLDEPTTGLDPNTRIAVWHIIEKLIKEYKLTVFLTTHYMEEVTKADYVVILDEGRIVTEGTPDELKNKYTTDYLRVINKKNSILEDIFKQEKKHYSYRGNAYYVHVDTPIEAVDIVKKHSKYIKDFEIIKGNMDDVFLQATGKALEDDEL